MSRGIEKNTECLCLDARGNARSRDALTSDHKTEADQDQHGGLVVQPVYVVVDDAALRLDELLKRSKKLKHFGSGTDELKQTAGKAIGVMA